MKNIRQVGTAIVTTIAVMSMAACSGAADVDSNQSAASGTDGGKKTNLSQVKPSDYLHAKYDELKQGGELNLSTTEIQGQQNPFHQDASLYTQRLWYWYNPQIILFDDDGKPYPNPDYLTSVKDEVKDGNTIVTYKINPKAHFNNGDPIDWRAFAATWKGNNGKDKRFTPVLTDGYRNIKSVEKGADDREVIVTFDGPYPFWESLFNMIANPKMADPEFFQKGYIKQLHPELGAGPYKIDQVDFQQGTVVLTPNEQWWGRKGKLDRVNIKQLEDQAELNAFRNGEIDMIGAVSKNSQAVVKGLPNVTVYSSLYPVNYYLILNSQSEPLKDKNVRKAVFSAIDRKQISQIRFSGVKVPDKNGKLTKDFTEPQPGSFLFFPAQPEYQDNFKDVINYDPELSNKLLDEAGWKPGPDGIREKDGKELSLRYPLVGDSQINKGIARAYQAIFKKVGIKLEIEEKPLREFSTVYTKREFDIFSVGNRHLNPFGVTFIGQMFATDASQNLSGTGTKEFDEKIAAMQKLPTKEEQVKRANELEREALSQYGIIPTFTGPSLIAVKDGLAGVGSMGFTMLPKELIGWKK